MGFVRFLLASGVVLCHSSSVFDFMPVAGSLAVHCFYIISGFYMTMILNEKYVGKHAVKLFYLNRATKLYPLYWLSVFLSLIWGIYVFHKGCPGTILQYAKGWPLHVGALTYLVVINIFLIGLETVFFFGIKKGDLYFTKDFNQSTPKLYTLAFNSVAWTVGLEMLFYLVAPFIMRKELKLLILFFILSFALRIILIFNGINISILDDVFFPTQIMFFMLGGLSYHMYLKLKIKPLNEKLILFINIIYVLFICFYYKLFPDSLFQQVLLFACTAIAIPVIFIRTHKSKVDKFWGDLSYPIYILQSLVLSITRVHVFPKIWGLGFTTLLVLIFLSIIVNKLITYPLEEIRINRVRTLKEA